jgi:hypothetical protein
MGDATSEVSGTEEILRIERERVRALVSNDFQTADRLHAPDYQLIPPSGQSLSKHSYLDLLASGRFQYAAFEPVGQLMVRRHDVTAIVRYQVRIAVVIDGQLRPPIHAWHTDYYESRDGQWQAVWSQATEITTA